MGTDGNTYRAAEDANEFTRRVHTRTCASPSYPCKSVKSVVWAALSKIKRPLLRDNSLRGPGLCGVYPLPPRSRSPIVRPPSSPLAAALAALSGEHH